MRLRGHYLILPCLQSPSDITKEPPAHRTVVSPSRASHNSPTLATGELPRPRMQIKGSDSSADREASASPPCRRTSASSCTQPQDVRNQRSTQLPGPRRCLNPPSPTLPCTSPEGAEEDS